MASGSRRRHGLYCRIHSRVARWSARSGDYDGTPDNSYAPVPSASSSPSQCREPSPQTRSAAAPSHIRSVAHARSTSRPGRSATPSRSWEPPTPRNSTDSTSISSPDIIEVIRRLPPPSSGDSASPPRSEYFYVTSTDDSPGLSYERPPMINETRRLTSMGSSDTLRRPALAAGNRPSSPPASKPLASSPVSGVTRITLPEPSPERDISRLPPASSPSHSRRASHDLSLSKGATSHQRPLTRQRGRPRLRPTQNDVRFEPAKFKGQFVSDARLREDGATCASENTSGSPSSSFVDFGTIRNSEQAVSEHDPDIRTRVFFAITPKASDDQLPGFKLSIIVGLQSPASRSFDDAMARASAACTVYEHELSQLSLEIRERSKLDDGRDVFKAIMTYLRGQLHHFVSIDMDIQDSQADDVDRPMNAFGNGLPHLRYLRIGGNTSGARLLSLRGTSLRGLHIMGPVCAQDVLKLAMSFPHLDVLRLESVVDDTIFIKHDLDPKSRPSESDFPAYMYMEADVAELACLLNHIPRQVHLYATLNAATLRRSFDANPAWFLRYPTVQPSVVMTLSSALSPVAAQ